jgi:hypothetical protein
MLDGRRWRCQMDEGIRRKLEVGRRALEFARAHPDSNPKYIAAVARLEALLARAAELETELEQEEQQLRKQTENGKVIPFRKRTKGDPTKPAA